MDEATHTSHDGHDEHRHGEGCGHQAVDHGDHVDYLHGGHAHASHGDHWDEHPVAGPGGADGDDRTSWTLGAPEA